MKSVRWIFALAIGLTQVVMAANPPRIGDRPAEVGQQAFVRESSDGPGFVDVDVRDWTGTRRGTVATRIKLEFNPKTRKWEALVPVGRKTDGYTYKNVFYKDKRPPNVNGQAAVVAAAPDNEVSVLSLSSMYLGDDGLIHEEAFFGRLQRMIGLNELHIPDFFSSQLQADAEGLLTLFSVVNLLEYGPNAPSFSFGDEFMITDGVIANFPGMQFSSTPFAFDPLLGFVGTAFNGLATIHAAHEVFAAPEPSSVVLLFSALVLMFMTRRHQ